MTRRPALLHRLLETRLFRIRPDEPYPIRLGQRRIFVLPTRTGLMLGLTLVVMLLASINYSLSLGYALTFLLASAATVSIIHAFRNLLGLQVEGGQSDPAFAGGPLRMRLLLCNTASRHRYALTVHCGTARSDVDILPPLQKQTIELTLPTQHRGWQAVGRISIETRYPLGFIRAWSVFTPAHRALVYPHAETPQLPLPPGATASNRDDGAGGHQGDDFAGLRAYRPSDPTRHLAWKVLARGGPMLTKEFAGHASDTLKLSWTALPAGLDVEARLSRLTAWVLAAGDSTVFALELPDGSLPSGRGPRQRAEALRRLALFGHGHA